MTTAIASDFANNLRAQWPPKGEQLLPLPSALLREFAGLTGPIEAFGTCLEGSIEAGDLIWYSTHIQPRHGDFVVIQMHPDRQRAFEQRMGQSSGSPHLGIKRLEQRDGEWFLSADDYPEGFPVSDNIILGPVVFRLSRLHRAGTQGQVQRLRQKHGTLAREIQSFAAKAKSPAERLMARRQMEQLEKIRAKQQTIERAVIEADTLPTLPKAHCNSLHFGPGTQLEATGTPGIEPYAATEAYQISELTETAYGLGSHYVVDGTFTPSVDGVVELTASYDYRGLAVDGLGNAMVRSLFVLQNSSYSYGVAAQNGAGNSTWISQPHSDFFNVVGGSLVTFGLLLENFSGTEVMRIRNARNKAGFIKR